MKKGILLFAVAGIVGTLAFFPNGKSYSNIAAPPAGYTGAPLAGGGFEPNCTTSGCHSDNAANPNDVSITLSSVSTPNIATGFTPGSQYNMYVNAGGSAQEGGFELTAIDANGNAAGTFALTNTSNTSLSTLNGRQYVGHKNANGNIAWSFKWTAPSTSNDVYFYLAVNTGNNNGANTGDQIRLRTYKATTSSFAPVESTTGINSLQDADAAGIKVYPNPVKDQLNLNYAAAENAHVKADIYSLNGQLVMPLVDEDGEGHSSKTFNVNGQLSSGVYIMRMSIGSNNYFKKILVQQ